MGFTTVSKRIEADQRFEYEERERVRTGWGRKRASLCIREAPNDWLFVLLLSLIFLSRSKRGREEGEEEEKKRRRGSIGVDFSTRFFFGWRTTLCHTTGIMMISKDDRRDNVRYPSAWYPGMLRWYDNKDRRPMKISALWQVMTNAVAVVFVLRRSVHSTSRSNPSSTDAKTGGGSNGSIWY